MQPHLADDVHQHVTSTTSVNRRIGDRFENTNLVVTRYVVVLNLGPAYRAELINESDGGIALQVRQLNPGAAVGRAIEVVYRGKRHAAEIRHITQNDSGFLVGLQWKYCRRQ